MRRAGFMTAADRNAPALKGALLGVGASSQGWPEKALPQAAGRDGSAHVEPHEMGLAARAIAKGAEQSGTFLRYAVHTTLLSAFGGMAILAFRTIFRLLPTVNFSALDEEDLEWGE